MSNRNSWIDDLSDDSDHDNSGNKRRVVRTFGHQPRSNPGSRYAPANTRSSKYYSSDEDSNEDDGMIRRRNSDDRRDFDRITIKQPARGNPRRTNSGISRGSHDTQGFVPRGISNSASRASYDTADPVIHRNHSGSSEEAIGSTHCEAGSGRDKDDIPWAKVPKKFLADNNNSTILEAELANKSSVARRGSSRRRESVEYEDDNTSRSDESARTIEEFDGIPSEGRVTTSNKGGSMSHSNIDGVYGSDIIASGHGPAHASTLMGINDHSEDFNDYNSGSLNGSVGPRIIGSLLHDGANDEDYIPRLKASNREGLSDGQSFRKRRERDASNTGEMHPLRQPSECLPLSRSVRSGEESVENDTCRSVKGGGWLTEDTEESQRGGESEGVSVASTTGSASTSGTGKPERRGVKKTYHSKTAARSRAQSKEKSNGAPPLFDNRPPPAYSHNPIPDESNQNDSSEGILQEDIYADSAANGDMNNPMSNNRFSFVQIAHPKGRRTDHVQCTVIRERNSIHDKLYPSYRMILEETGKTLIIAKKMNMNRTSNYHLFDMTRGLLSNKLSKKSGNYIGKLRAKNMNRTDYVLLNQNSIKEEIAGIRFDRLTLINQIKEGNQPRKMKVMIPPLDENTNIPIPNKTKDGEINSFAEKFNNIELAKMKGKKSNNLLIYESKDPVYENGNYRLNFNGRVSMPSVKNFQMVNSDDINAIICQFGKVEEDVFHLDYKAPFNACQAFALALCQFNL